MAEQNTRNAAELAAGRKLGPSENGQEQRMIIEWPAAHAFANGDTVGTGMILKRGTRLTALPLISFATGAASSTLSLGLRDPVTKTAIDATAIVNALAITTAATASSATGTKYVNGQRYLLPQDAEVYATLGGATPQANQAIRVEIPYITP